MSQAHPNHLRTRWPFLAGGIGNGGRVGGTAINGLAGGMCSTDVRGGIRATGLAGGMRATDPARGVRGTALAGDILATGVAGGIRPTALAGGIRSTGLAGGIGGTGLAGGIRSTALAGGIRAADLGSGIRGTGLAGAIRGTERARGIRRPAAFGAGRGAPGSARSAGALSASAGALASPRGVVPGPTKMVSLGRAGSGKTATLARAFGSHPTLDSGSLFAAAARRAEPIGGSFARTMRAASAVDVVAAFGGAPTIKRSSLAAMLRVLKRGGDAAAARWSTPTTVRSWNPLAWAFLAVAPPHAREALIDILSLVRRWSAAIVKTILLAVPQRPLRPATTELSSVITCHGPPAPLAMPIPPAVVSARP